MNGNKANAIKRKAQKQILWNSIKTNLALHRITLKAVCEAAGVNYTCAGNGMSNPDLLSVAKFEIIDNKLKEIILSKEKSNG